MIYGISGYKQSGKNTVALIWQLLTLYYTPEGQGVISKYKSDVDYVFSCLNGEEPYQRYSHYFFWEEKSFAKKLKMIVSLLTGCNIEALESEEFKNKTVPITWSNSKLGITTYRDMLQKIGTELFRENIHNRIWIDLLFEDYKESPFTRWLITDVRFRDEANEVINRGGFIIKINRGTSESSHLSERDMEGYLNYKYIIDNNGTLYDLIGKVKNIMRAEHLI